MLHLATSRFLEGKCYQRNFWVIIISLAALSIHIIAQNSQYSTSTIKIDSLSWTEIGTGVEYSIVDSALGEDVFIGIGGWKVNQVLARSWVTALYPAKLQAIGVRHLYTVKGPQDEHYQSREIGTLDLAHHLLSRIQLYNAINRIIIAGHSSGAYVADELLQDLFGNTGIDANHLTDGKIHYFVLDEATTTIPNSVDANRLGHIYGVYAIVPSLNLSSYAPDAMITLGNNYGFRSSTVVIDASTSGCIGKWCLHMTMINQNPYQSDWYDSRDYGAINSEHPVQTAYLDVLTEILGEPYLNKFYAKLNIDSVLFRIKFSNPKKNQFTSNLIYSNSNGSQIDSLSLYDDGMHGDSLANDGLYAVYIPPQSNEDFYALSVSITNNQTQNYYILHLSNNCKFTTAGPVKLDSLLFTKGIITYRIKPYVHNWSHTKTISNASIKLISNDPWVRMSEKMTTIPDISAGTTVGANSWITFQVIDSLFPGYFNFKAEIMVDGLTYWVDSTKMIVTGVEDEVRQPLNFNLVQNYPNPFNPSTTIKYSIPKQSNVTLKVYNVLGSEVRTLVNKEQPQGNYKLEFDGAQLTSGIYFYTLSAGDYSNTKKMLLIK